VRSGAGATRPEAGLIVAGLVLAYGIPALQIVVAQLWSSGVINPDPNGTLIQSLQSGSAWEVLLGPIGLAVAGRGARLRGPIAWILLFGLGIVVGAALWFVGAAYLGGLTGEPF
jgi:hypothetical protein